MRLPLKTKLFIGIAVAIIFVLLLSSLSYYTSIKQREGEAMVSHTIQVRSKLRDISINLKDYTSSMRTMRRYENATNLYSDLTPATISKSVDELNLLVSDNKFQQTKLPELRGRLSAVLNLWSGTNFQAARSNALVEREYYSQETKILYEINEIIREMDNEEARLLKNRQATTDQLLDFNNLANIGGTLLILTIVLLLCIVINREFSQRMRAEKKLKENLDTLEAVNIKTSNYNEVLNGAQSLIAACQQATSTSEFMSIALREVAAFLQSPAAVMYSADEANENALTATTFHGVEPTALQQKIRLQQLPVDTSNRKQIVAIAKDIPATFWNIATTMGSAQPGALAYLFLNTSTHRIGIIEVGSFTSFTQLQLDYMNMIGPAIAVRLAAVQVEESRAGLLLQLQEKQEILINQQEELRLANDELTQQTHVLQASEEELRVQEEELKQINVELEEKNAAIESAREVLTLKAAELEVSGKYKSEFLANMSHELRTPLNSVLILASLLRDNKDHNLTPKQIEYSNIIHKSGSDLLKLINDILDLSKIESGKVDLVAETISISSLQENMRQLFFVLAEQNEINFEINISNGVPGEIVSDRQKLEQVLKNLLSNAFKFTPRKGTISLNIRPDSTNNANIIFDVKDTGIGIPQDKQAIVFEAFKQADGSTNRKYGGTGLGLSISRELAKILGGSITLSSKENEGSIFSIILPKAIEKTETATETATHQINVPPTIPQALNTGLAKNISGNDKTILIIEDDANFSSILQTFAEERQYKTLLAFNGKEGLEIAAEHTPDAIILDMQLPVMDGWEVLKRLKDHEQLKHIPVHVISASDDVQLPLPGAIAYLKKPVSKEALDEAFSFIGLKVQSQGKKLLILKGATLNGDLLDNFLQQIPAQITVETAENFDEAILLGKEHAYGCIIADIGNDIDKGLVNIENLKASQPFKDTSVIIFIDKEISQADERKLKRVSEAVVMNSKEVQRRLADELELFLHKLKQTDQKPPIQRTLAPIDTEVLKGKKVLLADDDMRNVFALVSLLEEQGMEVTTAGNGREAVEALEDAWQPHIVLMDIMMPEMDGYEAMQIIRNRLQLRDLPMIAITAKAMAEDRELCLAAGASDYISKPVDTQKLLSLMRVWLSQ